MSQVARDDSSERGSSANGADVADHDDQDNDRTIETEEEHAAPIDVKAAAPGLRAGLAVVLFVIVALAGIGGWWGFDAYKSVQVQRQHARFLEVGKEAAVKLTTINYTNADADVKRILDSATGRFSDDFRTRSQPFVAMVKKVQSTTVGTVSEAGLESVEGDKARVLVSVSVKTSLGNGGGQPVHVWRMRIELQKVGNDTKVSNVEFVP